MNQKFEKLDDGKIKWTYQKDMKDHEDKEFGKVGVYTGYDEITFDSFEQALSILDRDESETEKMVEQYKEEMDKTTHTLETNIDIKALVEKVGELNTTFKETTGDKIFALYNNDPKKYTKLFQAFNESKKYIQEEIDILNKEYQKYVTHDVAKKNYEFSKEQHEKIIEQKQQLLSLK